MADAGGPEAGGRFFDGVCQQDLQMRVILVSVVVHG